MKRPAQSVRASMRGLPIAARRVVVLAACFAAAAAAPPAAGQTPTSNLPRQLQSVGFDQRLGAQVPLDAQFVDERGKSVRLSDYVHDKPVILVMAYYRCPMLCTQVLNGLAQGMLDMNFDAGKEFNVVTVSFDPREKPALAAAKKETYIGRYRRPGAAEGWHFLTGKEPDIRRLAQSIGFRYHYDSETAQYAHAAGIVILTPKGKVSRYFYDVNYSGRDLRLGLVEASANTIGSPVDQVLLFCFHYDPSAGKYDLAVLNFVRLGGVVTMLALILFFGLQFRRERRALRMAGATSELTDASPATTSDLHSAD